MKIRRRFASRPDWGRLLRPFRGLAEKLRPVTGRVGELVGRLTAGGRRIVVLGAAVFVGALVVGYLLAALVFFPAPIFASSRSVPRVIGMGTDEARETLLQSGFTLVETERVAHPSIGLGRVVWQDPPPDVVLTEGMDVRAAVSAGPQRIPVPDVAGYDSANARMLIEGAGLVIGGLVSAQAPTPANVAVNTRPPAGTTLLPGSPVTLVVSIGEATIRVPSVIGMTLDEARLVLDLAGLALGNSYRRSSRLAAPHEVFSQTPEAGTLSAPGARVNIVIVSGN